MRGREPRGRGVKRLVGDMVVVSGIVKMWRVVNGLKEDSGGDIESLRGICTF